MNYNDVNIKELMKNGKKISNFDILSQILSPISLKYKTKLYGDNEDNETTNNIIKISIPRETVSPDNTVLNLFFCID